MKHVWHSDSGPKRVDRLIKELESLPSEWLVTTYDWGFHVQSPEEPYSRSEHAQVTPEAERCECPCHRGKQCDHPVTQDEPNCTHCGRRAPI